MARSLLCHGTGKRRVCNGANQLSSRLNLIVKQPLQIPELFTSSNRLSTITIFDRVNFEENERLKPLRLRVAELGFYQFGFNLRCFYCMSKGKDILGLDPSSSVEISDVHSENNCIWYLTLKTHCKEFGSPEEECPNCYNEVHYLHALLPCGHLLCHICALQLEICPWCTFVIGAIIRIRKSGIVDCNGEGQPGVVLQAPTLHREV